MNSHPFSSAVLAKALKYDRPFKLTELGEELEELEEILDESGFFFCNFDNCGTREYLSKKYFFNASSFTVHFTSYEESRGILCAPLRFLPFTKETPELKIDGKIIPISKQKFPLKCLEQVYSLDHGQELVKFLNKNSDNTVFSLKAVSGLELDIYDLSSLSIKPGDHLRLHLNNDSLVGEIISSEDLNWAQAQSWCEKFEKSLMSVLREFGPFTDVYSQLEMAFFYGDQSLRNSSAIAIRDFLKLSKKVELVDFTFQKIIWFSGNSPLSAPEVERKISLIQDNFHNKPFVDSSFFNILDKDLRKHFSTVSEIQQNEFKAESSFDKQLQRTIRRIAIWISQNNHIIADKEMPKNEVLMFDAAFTELQFLCIYYMKNKSSQDEQEHFQSALEINFEILSELMAFLQEYYLSI